MPYLYSFCYNRLLTASKSIFYVIAGAGILATILFIIVSILAERDKKKYLEEHAELMEMLGEEEDPEL